MPKTPSRRVHSRFTCDLPVDVHSGASAAKLAEGRLVDLGMGGGAVAAPASLQRGATYEFRFNWGKERLAVMGCVAWTGPRAKEPPYAVKYGVSFSLTAQQERLLRTLVDKLAGVK